MGERQEGPESADVQATLERIAGERRFVVRNLGHASAFEVHFVVEPESGKNSPVIARQLEEGFPVDELPPAGSESLLAIITPGTGIRFRATVSWKNPDGSRGEKVFDLSA